MDLRKDITLTTDASEHSISGILSQERHPIMYLSRRLTNTEFDYSNIEKEALAMVWTSTRPQQFLIGKMSFEKWSKTIRVYIQSKKRITQSREIENTKMGNKINGIWIWYRICQRNLILHVDALSRLRFYKESNDKIEDEFEDTFYIRYRLMFRD